MLLFLYIILFSAYLLLNAVDAHAESIFDLSNPVNGAVTHWSGFEHLFSTDMRVLLNTIQGAPSSLFIPHTFVGEFFTGCMLSDAHITRFRGDKGIGNSFFKMQLKADQRSLILLCLVACFLERMGLGTGKITLRVYGDRKYLDLWSKRHPVFTEARKHWYHSNTSDRKLPANVVDFLTPTCLTLWIMGDGNWATHGLSLSTHGYTEQDVIALVDALVLKYNLNAKLRFQTTSRYPDRRYPVIALGHASMPIIQNLVAPLTPHGWLYKIFNQSADCGLVAAKAATSREVEWAKHILL